MNQEIEHRLAILRRRQVEQRTGLSRSTFYQYIKGGLLSKPGASRSARRRVARVRGYRLDRWANQDRPLA